MPAPLYVWLWDAGPRFSGITDDESTAKDAVLSCLLRGESGRVERAVFKYPVADYIGAYLRRGVGWTTVRPWRGPATWDEFPCAQALAS